MHRLNNGLFDVRRHRAVCARIKSSQGIRLHAEKSPKDNLGVTEKPDRKEESLGLRTVCANEISLRKNVENYSSHVRNVN